MFNTGSAALDVTVNGTNMNIGTDLLQAIHIIEHVHSNKPSVQLTFVDNKQAAGGWGTFQDGAKVQVQIGDGRTDPLTYAFRQFGVDGIEPKAAGDLINLAGVADIMPWFTSVVTKAHKGNASDVLTSLAQQFGISKVDVDATQDKMTWLPDGRTVAQFARNMVDHAWMGAGSSPLKALTSEAGQWMLRVKDIMKTGSSSTTLISNGLPGAGTDGPAVWSHVIKSHGGALNSFANYGLKLSTGSLGGNPENFFKLDINALTSFIGINGDIASAVNTARTIFSPFAHGNTHDKWHQAKHANIKSRAAFTSEVSVLLQEKTGLRLLDDVTAMLANSAGQMDAAYSGAYKVSGITRSIRRGNYTELLTLTSMGTNSQGSADSNGGSQ